MKKSSFLQYIVVSLTVIVILTLIIIAINAMVSSKDTLPFDKSRFFNDIFGFILDVLALFIAFELGQVFWERQKKMEKKQNIYQSMLLYLGKLIEIANHLDTIVSSSENQRFIDELRQDYQETIMKISLWGDWFFTLFTDIEFVDQQFINHYIDNIYPIIVRLSKKDVLWGNQEWLRNAISQLKDKIIQMKSIKMS